MDDRSATANYRAAGPCLRKAERDIVFTSADVKPSGHDLEVIMVDDGTKPSNDRLRRARESIRSPSGSGRPMSRRELAEAASLHLPRPIDAKYVAKLERGMHRWPNQACRDALRQALGARDDRELGFYVDRPVKADGGLQRLRTSAGASRPAAPARDHDEAAGIRCDLVVTDELEEIEQRRSWLGTLHVDDGKLVYLESAVVAAVDDIERRPPGELAASVRYLRSNVQAMLENAQHPPARSRMYAVAVYLSGVLGALSLDLGRVRVARSYAREAFDLANADGSGDLGSWARATQSLIEYYAGSYHDALAFAQDGLRLSQSGVHVVRLAINGEARALAKMGERYGVDKAVEQGFAGLEMQEAIAGVSPSLAIGTYCQARAAANAATAYLSLHSAGKVEIFGKQALAAFDRDGLSGPRALTRLDLATALLLQRDAEPERASDLVRQALDATSVQQFHSVAVRTREFLGAAKPWERTAAVRDIAELVAARSTDSTQRDGAV